MDYFLALIASFVFVGLKSWQQQNVTYEKYRWILPTSVLMAAVEVYVIGLIAIRRFDWALILAIGVGSGLGSTFATWLHVRMRR